MGYNWQSIDIPNYVNKKNSAATAFKNKRPPKGKEKKLYPIR